MSDLLQLTSHLYIPTNPQELLQAQRLFHGRGHAYNGLHHVTIDWLPPVALITLFTPESNTQIAALADYLLTQLPSCKSVQVQHRHKLSGPIDIVRGGNNYTAGYHGK